MTASCRRASILLALIACFAPASAAQPPDDPPGAQPASAPTPPLKSKAELDAWLARASAPTPLDALPPLPRQRFLDNLVFTPRGVGGFSFGDLQLELTPSQARAVLTLFGLEEYGNDLDTRLSEGEAWPVPAQPSGIERDYDALEREIRRKDIDWSAVETRYAYRLRPLFTEESLRGLTLRDLVHAMLAAQLVGRMKHDPGYSNDVSAAVQELERRGKATKSDLRAAYDGLLIARRFNDARLFSGRHPNADLPAIPAISDSLPSDIKSPTLWHFDPSGRSLVRQAANLAPAQILIIAGCHFSQDAVEDIGKDPVLGPLFAAHGQWLFLPPGGEDLDLARDWNRKFPQAPVGMLYARDEWHLLPER